MTSSYVGSLLEGRALDDALHDIAREATKAVVGVDSAGAVVQRGPHRVRAASADLAATVDATQYRIEQGPCLHAYHTGTVVVLDLGEQDHRWPDFQAAAVAAGARTVLSLPLRLDTQTIGSLNLYSRTSGVFDAKAVHEAELFARPSGLRLSQLGVAVHAVEAAEVVGLELQDRVTIDLALGFLMGLHRDVSVDRARTRLAQTANDLGLDVSTAAARLVASPSDQGEAWR